MINHVAISTGWTLDYVGWHLDLPRLRSLNKYWRKYPPIHVMIKAYLGYKEPAMPIEESTSDTVVSDQELSMDQFFSAVPQRAFQPPVVKNGN